MKKIAVITLGALPVPATKGGAVENLIQTLLEKNEEFRYFSFVVFSSKDSCAERVSAWYKLAKFVFFPMSGAWNFLMRAFFSFANKISPYYFGNWFYLRVERQLRKSECDFVILENCPLFAIPLRKTFPKCKIISHLHNYSVFSGCKHERQIIEATDTFWGVSEFICQGIRRCSPSPKNVQCFYNGIDISIFRDSKNLQKSCDIKRALGITHSDFVFLFSGRLVPGKGVEELLESFSIVASKYSYVKLLFLGGGKLLDTLKSRAKILADRVIFTDRISYERIPEFICLGNAAVFPSIDEEAFSLSLLEAMSIGLPVIISDSGGMPELVGDDLKGTIVKRGEGFVSLLASAMERLLEKRELREELGRKVHIRSELFSKRAYWCRFVELCNAETKMN